MISISKLKSKRVRILCFLFILVGLFCFSPKVSAYDSTRTGGINRNNSKLGYAKNKSGATWYYYEITDSHGEESVKVPFNDGYDDKTKVTVDISNNGCGKYKGFWVLLFNEYNIEEYDNDPGFGSSNNGRPARSLYLNEIRTDSFRGNVNNVIYYYNGVTPNDDNQNGIKATKTGDFNEVKEYFEKVQNNEENKLNGRSQIWGSASKLQYFCYGSGYTSDNYNGQFSSVSQVRIKETSNGLETEYSTPNPDRVSRTRGSNNVSEGDIKLQFKHTILIPVKDEIKNYAKEEMLTFSVTTNGPVELTDAMSWSNLDGYNDEFSIVAFDSDSRDGEGLLSGYVVSEDIIVEVTINMSRNSPPKTFCQSVRYKPFLFSVNDGNVTIDDSSSSDVSAYSGNSAACITLSSEESLFDNLACGYMTNNNEGKYIIDDVGHGYFDHSPGKELSGQLGNTVGAIAVINYNNETEIPGQYQSKSWYYTTYKNENSTVKVFAKPGDNVAFAVDICFGAQDVTRDGKTGSRNYYLDDSNDKINRFKVESDVKLGRIGNQIYDWVEVNNTELRESGSYVADLQEKLNINSGCIRKIKAKTTSISFSFPDRQYDPGDETLIPIDDCDLGYYDSSGSLIRYDLDGKRVTENRNYTCKFYQKYGMTSVDAAFQIPGFADASDYSSLGCGSAARTGATSLVGKTMDYSLNYRYLTAWVSYYYKTTGGCGCNNNTLTYEQKYVSNYDEAYAYANDGSFKPGRLGVGGGYINGNVTQTRKCQDNGECIVGGELKEDYKKPDWTEDISLGYNSGRVIKKTAQVIVPYNFSTTVSSRIDDTNSDGVVFAGESVSSHHAVYIDARLNPLTDKENKYATMTPTDTKITVIEFLVDKETNYNDIMNDLAEKTDVSNASDLCSGDHPNYVAASSLYKGCKEYIGGRADSYKDGNISGTGLSNPNNIIKSGSANPTSNPAGAQYDEFDFKRAVPDVEAGTKYCVAVAINHADSHNLYGQDLTVDNGANNISVGTYSRPATAGTYYHISAPSCRTIAKRPTFQVWNGGVYSSGDIISANTTKVTNANLGTGFKDEGGYTRRLFGSWAEYYVEALGTVSNFASGSAYGYTNNMSSLGQTRSSISERDYCKTSRLTIANVNCGSGEIGEANESIGINDSDAFIRRLESRYTKSTLASSDDGYNNLRANTEFDVDDQDSYTDSPTQAAKGVFSWKNNDCGRYQSIVVAGAYTVSGCFIATNATAANNTRYAYITNDNHNVEIDGFTQLGGTRVIKVDGTLKIKGNICLGSYDLDVTVVTGTCSEGSQNVTLGSNGNISSFNDISQIPQVIIIADNIEIAPEVSEVDAWLIAKGSSNGQGYIDTCSTSDSLTSANCNITLKINGPVFTGSLYMNRTAGAWPGNNGGNNYNNTTQPADSGDVASRLLNEDGSITPAEIFDLRPDTYLWAYYQAQRFSQAIVTYSRELAPRY